jgi:subtilisin family serine protease
LISWSDILNTSCGNHILSDSYIDFIADYELASSEELANSEICSIQIDSTFSAVYIPDILVPEQSLNAYGYKVFVRLLGLMDEQSIEASGVKRLRNISGLNFRGQGVLIGIVDTGIDYTHKAFINADGTTKIVSIWDQTIQVGPPPEGLYYGTEYTRDQINTALRSNDPRALVPSTDDIGHGTFLAGIAAGFEDSVNEFTGVVPDAELVVVKLKPAKKLVRDFYLVNQDTICFQENDVMLGVKYLLSMAEKYKRPISICIGLGTSQGDHDESGALSIYLSSVAQMNGVSVSIAAGNEGSSRHHYESIMLVGTNIEAIELNVGPKEQGIYLEIWGNSPNTFGIDLISPGGEYLPLIVPRINERREISFIFETTIINVYFQLVGSRAGAQLVILRLKNPTEGIWRIGIHKMNRTLPLNLNMWLPIRGFIGEETYFISSSPYTTLTSPGNVYIPIVATAYNNSNDSLYINASRGFTRTGRIAPSLAAPGVNLIGPSLGNSFTTMSGTSVAAAHTTGIAAMLLEWGLVRKVLDNMDGTDVKNLLLRGAKRDPNITYPSREWGYGIIDIFGVFENLRGNL